MGQLEANRLKLVGFGSAQERKSVPMQGDIVLDMVNHLNDNSIAFSRHYLWPREVTIDGHNGLGVAQSCCICHLDLHVTWYRDKNNLPYSCTAMEESELRTHIELVMPGWWGDCGVRESKQRDA